MDNPIICPFPVVIDTAEQAPFQFQELAGNANEGRRPFVVRTIRKHLKTGDYSIEGFEDAIAIERKSKVDLFGCMGNDRERFEKQIFRLNELPHGFVVVEADWPGIFQGSGQSGLRPESVYGTVISWQQKYPRVHWWLMPTRGLAEKTAFRILKQFWKNQQAVK